MGSGNLQLCLIQLGITNHEDLGFKFHHDQHWDARIIIPRSQSEDSYYLQAITWTLPIASTIERRHGESTPLICQVEYHVW
jgi:hypothetical protein